MLRIQTLNLYGQALSMVSKQLAKADFYCFQEVPKTLFSNLSSKSDSTRRGKAPSSYGTPITR